MRSLFVLLLLSLLPLFAHASRDAEHVWVFPCADCRYNDAQQLVIQQAAPTFRCVSSEPGRPISIDNQRCYSQPRYSAVLDKRTHTLWGFRLSHTQQGMYPPLMQLQVVDHGFTPNTEELIRNGVAYTQALGQALQRVANRVGGSFTSAQQQQDWLAQVSSNRRVTSTAQTPFSCQQSSEYQAVTAALSGAFRNRLRTAVNEAFLQEDLSLSTNFDEKTFNGFGLEVSKAGVGVSVSWDNEPVARSVIFNYPVPDALATEDHQHGSRVVFNIRPEQQSLTISLDASKTHIGGSYWSVLATPNLAPLELSPCAKMAFDRVYRRSQSTELGTIGSQRYYPKPAAGQPLPPSHRQPDNSWQLQQCEVHYYDDNGRLLVTFRVLC